MAEFKPKPGSFLPYLESSRGEKAHPSSAPASPLTILEVLFRQPQQALPIFDLQSLSAIAPSRYADALKMLTDNGYIKIEGTAPSQIVQLTPAGLEAVKLSRPA